MGVGKRTRVIIGMVGVTESCGSAVCVTGISSRSAVSCESLRRVYRRISPPFLTHGLFIVAIVQAHRMNLLNMVFFICLLLLLACLLSWLLIKHLSILYTDGKADLSGRGNPNQKAQTSHFLWGEKFTWEQKAAWKMKRSKKTSVRVFSCCTRWVWLTAHHLCVLLMFGMCNTGKSGETV